MGINVLEIELAPNTLTKSGTGIDHGQMMGGTTVKCGLRSCSTVALVPARTRAAAAALREAGWSLTVKYGWLCPTHAAVYHGEQ